MQAHLAKRTLSIAIIATLLANFWLGVSMAQDGTIPAIPFNHLNEGGPCVPFNESPLSLKDIDGVVGPDANGFILPHDLDGDGHSNEAEILARSDPTDEASTPINRDGDAYNIAADECDFNGDIPRDVRVTILNKAALDVTPVVRGGSFDVDVLVEEAMPPLGFQATDAADIELMITMSNGQTRDEDLVDAPERLDTGKYRFTVETRLDDFTDAETPWDIDVEVETINGKQGNVFAGVHVEGQQLQATQHALVLVEPAEFDVDIETLLCAPVFITIDSSSGDEDDGEDVPADGSIGFTVKLSNPTAHAVQVLFSTIAGTGSANAGPDYVAVTNQPIRFPAGSTEQFVLVTTKADAIIEGPEAFYVRLTSPSGAVLADTLAEGLIRDNDNPETPAVPPPAFVSIPDVETSEGDSGTSTVTFEIRLSAPAEDDVVLTYATEAGGAQAGSDFVATTGSVTIGPGMQSAVVPVSIRGDLDDEGDESFALRIDSISGPATLSENRGEATIVSDDAVGACLERTTFYAGEVITVRGRIVNPSTDAFIDDPASGRNANLVFRPTADFFGLTTVEGEDAQREMREFADADGIFWETTVDPATDLPFPIGFSEPLYALEVTIEDDALSAPNAGTSTQTSANALEDAPGQAIAKSVQIVIDQSSIDRRESFTFKAEYREHQNTGSGFDEGEFADPPETTVNAIVHNGDRNDPLATVVLTRTSTGNFTGGSFTTNIGTPLFCDDDADATDACSDPDSAGFLFVDVEINDVPASNSVVVRPVTVPGSIEEPGEEEEFTLFDDWLTQVQGGNTADPTVHIEYQLPVPRLQHYHDDLDGDPGAASFEVFDPTGESARDGEMTYEGNGLFTADAAINPGLAGAFPGTWTIVVTFTDDAFTPNYQVAERDFEVAPPQGLEVRQTRPEFHYTDVFGFNVDLNVDADEDDVPDHLADADISTLGVRGNADDKDAIFPGDEASSRRYVVIEGIAQDQVFTVYQNGEPFVLQGPEGPIPLPTIERDVAAALGNINDRTDCEEDSEPPSNPADFEWRLGAKVADLTSTTSKWRIALDLECDLITAGENKADVPLNVHLLVGKAAADPVGVSGAPADALAGLTYVAGDPTGTYSAVNRTTFDFEFTGASVLTSVAREHNGNDLEKTRVFDNLTIDYTFAAKFDPSELPPEKVSIHFVRAGIFNCLGSAATEWCLVETHSKSGPTTFGYQPMMDQGTGFRFETTISKDGDVLAQFAQSTSEGRARYIARIRHVNMDGYDFVHPLEFAQENEDLVNAAPTKPDIDTKWDLDGEAFQFTVIPVKSEIKQVRDLHGYREQANKYQNISGGHDWQSWRSNNPAIAKPPGVTSTIVGLIEGNSIRFNGTVDAVDELLSGDIDVKDLEATLTGGFDSTNSPAPTSAAVLAGDADGDGINDNGLKFVKSANGQTAQFWARFDVSPPKLEELIGFSSMNGKYYNLNLKLTSWGDITATSTVKVTVDQNALVHVSLPKVQLEHVEGGTIVLSNPTKPVVKGTGTFFFTAFDDNGVVLDADPDTDPRKLDGLDVSFFKDQPDVQMIFTGNGADQGLNAHNGAQLFPLPVVIPNACPSTTTTVTPVNTADPLGRQLDPTRQCNQAEFYFPLRIGVDPLLMEIDLNLANPGGVTITPKTDDRVFGFDSNDQGADGYARLQRDGDARRVLVTEASWRTATRHAVEIDVDRDGAGGGAVDPYLGFTTNDGRLHLAMASDRGFTGNPATWEGEEDLQAPPTQWKIIECIIHQATAVAVPPTPPPITTGWLPDDSSSCPFIKSIEWVGVFNGLTPFTLYQVGVAEGTGLGNTGGCTNTAHPLGNDYPDRPGGGCHSTTTDDFEGDDQDGRFWIPRGFIWKDVTATGILPPAPFTKVANYTSTVVSIHPYAQLALPFFDSNTRQVVPAKDMLIPDGDYTVTARGFDGVEVIGDAFGESNEKQPMFSWSFAIDNNWDTDAFSNALENKTRDQLADGTHRQLTQLGVARAENPFGFPLAVGSVNVPRSDGRTTPVHANDSDPCDWDGDKIPNDVNCLGRVNLESALRTHPLVPDSPLDDPNGNGIPNIIDTTQRHRLDCANPASDTSNPRGDNDGDGWCDTEEAVFGSDPNNGLSQPGDRNGNRIPDEFEAVGDPLSGLVASTISGAVNTTCERLTGSKGAGANDAQRLAGCIQTALGAQIGDAVDEACDRLADGPGTGTTDAERLAGCANTFVAAQIGGVVAAACNALMQGSTTGPTPQDRLANCATAAATKTGADTVALLVTSVCTTVLASTGGDPTSPASVATCAQNFASATLAGVVTEACTRLSGGPGTGTMPQDRLAGCVQTFVNNGLGTAVATVCSTLGQGSVAGTTPQERLINCANGLTGGAVSTLVATVCSLPDAGPVASPSDPNQAVTCAINVGNAAAGDVFSAIVTAVCGLPNAGGTTTPGDPNEAARCANNVANGAANGVVTAVANAVCGLPQSGGPTSPGAGDISTCAVNAVNGAINSVIVEVCKLPGAGGTTSPSVGAAITCAQNFVNFQVTQLVATVATQVCNRLPGSGGPGSGSVPAFVTCVQNAIIAASGTATDPDGDGQPTQVEIAAGTNPFHHNSRVGNKGPIGFPGDWDADGFSDATELQVRSDPFRQCSTPLNMNGGIQGGVSHWPNLGRTC